MPLNIIKNSLVVFLSDSTCAIKVKTIFIQHFLLCFSMSGLCKVYWLPEFYKLTLLTSMFWLFAPSHLSSPFLVHLFGVGSSVKCETVMCTLVCRGREESQ